MGILIRVALAASVLLLSPAVADAQWPRFMPAGVPRLPDGKPNLNAPPPRTADGKPDLSGVWESVDPPGGGFFMDLASGLPPSDVVMTPWARAIAEQRERREHVDDPYGYCMPPGVPRINWSRAPMKIIQTPAVTAMHFETIAAQTFREVFTDGRSLPKGAQPTWLGYSVGRWEGDTFVVETTGFRDGGWLDTRKGRPHSDALHVIERLTRPSYGRLEMTVTINDPKAFVKPWTAKVPFRLLPDTSLIEMFCETHRETMENRQPDALGGTGEEPPSPR